MMTQSNFSKKSFVYNAVDENLTLNFCFELSDGSIIFELTKYTHSKVVSWGRGVHAYINDNKVVSWASKPRVENNSDF